jgi:hypothetical protein
VYTRWVSQNFIPDIKQKQLHVWSLLLSWNEVNSDAFLAHSTTVTKLGFTTLNLRISRAIWNEDVQTSSGQRNSVFLNVQARLCQCYSALWIVLF